MAWYVARSLNTLRDEINRSAPNRNKAADGTIGDAAHSARTSDHNPCSHHGAVCARDITHDPAGGFDSYKFADWLRARCQSGAEKRVKYIISNKRIASGTINNWNWRSYSGSNPHSRHVHVSVVHGPSAFDNPMTWGWGTTAPKPPPVKPPPTTTWYSKLMSNQPTLEAWRQGHRRQADAAPARRCRAHGPSQRGQLRRRVRQRHRELAQQLQGVGRWQARWHAVIHGRGVH